MGRLLAVALLLAAMPAGQGSPQGEWVSLFDGKSLSGWKETPFTGRGTARAANGMILLGSGAPMTGVTYTETVPKSNYEVRFEAQRIEGGDFFASLTFPVKDSFCTWVTGGWGGDIVGLSSIDGWDAADNETRAYLNFENGRWYSFRLQVTDARIQAWIDEKPMINVQIEGREIGLRFGEMKLNAPFGFASYGSTGGIRKVAYRVIAGPKR